jgi:hypothetical protein
MKMDSGANNLNKSVNNEVMNLSKRDILVFWGGSNDVNKNNSGLNHILNSVKACSHTNIILFSVPHRHDLKSSRFNKKVTRFNRKLAKCIKLFEHCTFVNVDLNRSLFANHGHRLNGSGKMQY